MNAPATLPTPRQDGWTPERRAAFLGALAEGHTVEAACGFVGLSVASAYALRRKPAGRAFALGWRASCLLGRERLADILTSRAIDGQVETLTRADGETVTRHRFDNRLATALLTRLDRMAGDGASPGSLGSAGSPAGAATGTPAAGAQADPVHAVAGDFAGFLALVEADAAAADVDAFVDAAIMRGNPQLPQLRAYRKGQEWFADEPKIARDYADEPFWYDADDDQMLTRFAPPPHFDGEEYGSYGDATYARTLTSGEEAFWHSWRSTVAEDEEEAGA